MQKELVLQLGKELTCPICLGLLKSAVHLPCNHCFCRACIQQSILVKTACPVCKQPAHKRDFRPAASVDQVVAAYTSMERALGVQILCSQPAKPPLQSEEEEPVKGKRKRLMSKGQKAAEAGKENEVPKGSAQSNKGTAKVGNRAQSMIEVADGSGQSDKGNEKVGNRAQGTALQSLEDGGDRGVFKAPKNMSRKGQVKGTARLNASLVPCVEAKQSAKEEASTGKRKGKVLKKKGGGKLSKSTKAKAQEEEQSLSAALPSLADSAPASEQRPLEVSEGGGRLQPFFWMGGPVATQDYERETQFRATQASPPLKFSDLLCSGGKSVKGTAEDTRSPGGLAPVRGGAEEAREGARTTRQAAKGRAKDAAALAKAGEAREKTAREEFYSCEDETALDASLNEDGLGKEEEAPAPDSVADSGQKEKKGRKKVKGTKGGRKLVEEQENEVPPVAKKAKAVQDREKLVSEIRTSVAAAVGVKASEAPSQAAKQTSAADKKGTTGAGKRKRGKGGGTAVSTEATAASTEATAVTAEENDTIAPNRTPHVNRRPAREVKETPSPPVDNPALKTPAPQQIDTGLCPSTSRPLNPQTPAVPHVPDACGFCGLDGDSEVAGKLVRKGATPQSLLVEEGFEGRGQDSEVGGKRRRVQLSSVFVHELCAQWAPNVFFEGEDLANLDSELVRSRHLKCHVCSRRGAALGCFLPRCRHTYHYACSRQLEGCRFDEDAYVMLCPEHASETLPYEMEEDETDQSDGEEEAADEGEPVEARHVATKRKVKEESSQSAAFSLHAFCHLYFAPKRPKSAPSVQAAPSFVKWAGAPGSKWVLTGSGLSSKEKDDLALFALSSGAQVVKDWSPAVTHVITGVAESGRSKRTLKYLTAVLTGQWVVTPAWVTESLKLSKPAKEVAFEVPGDLLNETGGPKKGRMAARKGAPPLFDGTEFFLSGDWPGTPSKADMAAVVTAGGGTVLARKPLPGQSTPHASQKSGASFKTIIVYFGGQSGSASGPPVIDSSASNVRRTEALGLSDMAGEGSAVVHHRWLLDSASAFRLQDASKY